jgi:hypothetical protein
MAYLTAAKGLVVYRNELSSPEGALVQADNVNIDEPDVITPRRGFSDYANPLPSEDQRVDQILSYKGIILRHFNNLLQYENSSGEFVNFNTAVSQLDDSIRIKSQESNGNLYFTSSDGIKKISLKNASDINVDSITPAGVPAAIDVSAQAQIIDGGFLPAESKVAYKVLFGYKDANNNLLLGSPSPRFTVTNRSKNISLPERTRVSLNYNEIQDEDYFIYSTKLETSGTDYMFWFNKTKEKPQQTTVSVDVDVSLEDGTGKYKTLLDLPGSTVANTHSVYVNPVNDHIYYCTSEGLYISIDNGLTFEVKLPSTRVYKVLYVNDALYAVTESGLYIFYDTTYNSFVQKTQADGLPSDNVRDITFSNNTFYFLSDTNVISKSLDFASSFTTVIGLGSNTVYQIHSETDSLYIATSSGLYISTNQGTSFVIRTSANGLGGDEVTSVNSNGSVIYTGHFGRFSVSTNSGTSFTSVILSGAGNVVDIKYKGQVVYAATESSGILVSKNNGTTFPVTITAASSNLFANRVVGIHIHKDRLYAASSPLGSLNKGLSVSRGVVDGDYILYETKSLSKFFIWFKRTSSGVVPDVVEKIGRIVVEVDLTTIELNVPSEPTDTPNPDQIAVSKLATAMSAFTNDIASVSVTGNQAVLTDKMDGEVPDATSNGTDDIVIAVSKGAVPLPDTYRLTIPEAFNKVQVRVDIKDVVSNEQAALFLAEEVSANIPDAEATVNGNTVTITNRNPGNVADCVTNIVDPNTAIVTNVVQQGLVTPGESCDTTVKFVVPFNITPNYFYQVYRSEIVTATDFLPLENIEPSDEFNLVIEKQVSTDGITVPTEIEIVDDTPDDFRASNTPLYNNALTGAGILQTNDQPPISKDLALFKNSVFYANTSGVNFLDLTLLPGVDLLNGTSLYIGDSTNVSKFNFIGSARTYNIKVDSKALTEEFQHIKIYTADNEYKFILWAALSADSVEPVEYREQGFEPIRVDLSFATSASEVKTAYQEIIEALGEYFIVDETYNSSPDTIVFQNIENGSSNAPSLVGNDPLSQWVLSSVDGSGEDYSQNNVLVSNSFSPSLALDKTARSLVRVINNDISCPVSAQYLSSPDTVPGKIKLKSKVLLDREFYLGLSTSDPTVVAVFNTAIPSITSPSSSSYDSISGNTVLNIAGHSFFVADKVIIKSFSQTYIKTIVATTANSISISGNITPTSSTDTVLYLTSTASSNDENPSRIYFSKLSQPEAVPIVNYLDIGSRDQSIKRIVALRDSLLVLKEDGIFVVSGSGAFNFSVRLLSSTSIITCPDSAQVLNNNLYFLSTQGIISVNENSDAIVSRQIENLIKDVTRNGFNYEKIGFGVGYDNDRAYLLWLPTEASDEVATQCYRYNIFERNWTRWTVPATCGAINRLDDTLYIGDGKRPYVQKERKNGDRTDHSDRNFTLSLASGNHLGTSLIMENVVELDVGDTIVQTQYVTIAYYNRLLRKLTSDYGLSFDYNSLEAVHGDNITQKIQELVNALNSDGVSIASPVVNSDEELKEYINSTIITALNDLNGPNVYKDYKEIIDVIDYEAVIAVINRFNNTVEVNYDIPFLEGSLEIYKHIKCVVEWQPQHFGDPSQLKQISESSVMFDQNNFYTAKLSFATDLSQNFVDIPMPGRGVGYWGYGIWGTPDFYWGGEGNDSPFRTIVPREKQRCRYLSLKMEHTEARSSFRVVGVSAPVRPLSTRAYRK